MPSSPEWSESKAWNTRSTQACHSSLSWTALQSSMAATQLSYLQATLSNRVQTTATVPALGQRQMLLYSMAGLSLSYWQGSFEKGLIAKHLCWDRL